MTLAEPEQSRTPGQVEGRLEEQSRAIDNLRCEMATPNCHNRTL